MDVWNNQLIDIGLNTLGYLIAGALGALIYSSMTARRTAPAKAETRPEVAPVASQPAAVVADSRFVDLRNEKKNDTPARPARRDKGEIMRLARKMIQAGADPETIKRTLPVTDGELNLLHAGTAR